MIDFSLFLLVRADHEGTIVFGIFVCFPNDCSVTMQSMLYTMCKKPCALSITGGGDECADSDEICGETDGYELPILSGTCQSSKFQS